MQLNNVEDEEKNEIPPTKEPPPHATTAQKLTHLLVTFVKIFFPSRTFLSFFVSSIIPSIAQILIPMFFTGNIPNESALAISSQFMFIFIALKVIQDGVGNSLFHFVGTHYKTRKSLAISAFRLSLLVLIVCGIASTIAMLLFSRQFVSLIDTPESISEATQRFFYTSAFTCTPTLLNTAFTNYLFISTSSWIIVAQAVTVLTTFLINFFTFGQHTFSLHWGVNEFGIHQVIMSTVTMLVTMGFVLLVEKMGPIEFFVKKLLPSSEEEVEASDSEKMNLRSFFNISWGNFADAIVRNFFFLAVTLKFVNHLGANESAAWNLLNGLIWGIILLPAFVIGNYTRVRIGHDSTRATIKEVVKESGLCLVAWIILMTVVSSTCWSTAASFLSKSNLKVAAMSHKMFYEMGWVFIIFAYENLLISVFQAIGKSQYIFYQSLTVNLIVYFPPWIMHLFGWLTPSYWLVVGLFIAAMALCGLLATFFAVIVWKSIPLDDLDTRAHL